MATKLTKLRIEELSGVDDPANDAPGWLVAKAREWKGEVEDLEKAAVALHELLSSQEIDLYFGDAPEVVNKAREMVAAHIDKDLEETDVDTDQAAGGIMDKLSALFSKAKTGEPTQPIVGTPAATREQVDRVTPAESHPGGPEVTEDQGKDEQIITGVEVNEAGEPGNPSQEILGTPAQTREDVDRVTPAEAGHNDPPYEVTDDQGKDEQEVHDPEEFRKAISEELENVIEDTIGPLRDAMFALAERTENLEKASAGRSSLNGQEVSKASEQVDGIGGAILAAAHGRKVQITG